MTVTTNELAKGASNRALVGQFVHQVTGMANELVRETVPSEFDVRYGHAMHVSPPRPRSRG
jgi:hypothetical protein